MKLTTEQIERILNEAPDGSDSVLIGRRVEYYRDTNGLEAYIVGEWRFIDSDIVPLDIVHHIDDLREILHLRSEVERLRGKLGEVGKVLCDVHAVTEWPTSYCISEIEEALNIDAFLKGEVK